MEYPQVAPRRPATLINKNDPSPSQPCAFLSLRCPASTSVNSCRCSAGLGSIGLWYTSQRQRYPPRACVELLETGNDSREVLLMMTPKLGYTCEYYSSAAASLMPWLVRPNRLEAILGDGQHLTLWWASITGLVLASPKTATETR